MFGVGVGDVQNEMNDCYHNKIGSKVYLWNDYNTHNQFLFFFAAVGVLGIVFLGSCQNKLASKVIEIAKSQENIKKIKTPEKEAFAKLSIKGMACAVSCAVIIEKELKKTSGIVSAKVDFEN